MVYVSVSVFNDAQVLGGCLESIREVLPDADIEVVDGAYSTWPGDEENSTDETEEVAGEYDALYNPAGPFQRERDKHVYRTHRAWDGQLCLLMDADERLTEFEISELDPSTAYQPRIHNVAVYGNRIAYWPRIFDPANVADINRWDAYQFNCPCEKTDAVTITHRHDLRDEQYRREKLERLENEDRFGMGYYADDPDEYVNLQMDVSTLEMPCPECGHNSLVKSPPSGFGGGPREFTNAVACLTGDCYRDVWDLHLGPENEYLPDRVEEGYAEDPDRLHMELWAEGCKFVIGVESGKFRRMQPAVEIWVDEMLTGEGDSSLFTDVRS